MLFKTLGFFLYIALFFYMCPIGREDAPNENFMTVLFKLLPMMQLVFAAMSTTVITKGHRIYKHRILLGMIFSMIGDVCLVWRVRLFIPGLLAFALAQYAYIQAYGFKPFGTTPVAMSCVMLGSCTFLYLNSSITSPIMQGLVLLYCILIYAMLWRAWVQQATNPSIGAACAVIGAIIFIVSDLTIAVDKWKHPVQQRENIVMGTYWLAQLFITASVAYYKPHPFRPEDTTVYVQQWKLN